MLKTIAREIKTLFNLYLSAKAKGVIARGIAASMMEAEKCAGENPKSFTPKYSPAGNIKSVTSENEPDPVPRAQGIRAGSFFKESAPPTSHYIALHPRDKSRGITGGNKNIGIHSEILPMWDFPIKRPMTISTVGVTEAAIMSMEVISTAGKVIFTLATTIPKTIEINSGFLKRLIKMSFKNPFCLCEKSKKPIPTVNIQNK